MKILVTGGAGFLGAYVMRAASEAGFQVIGLDTGSPSPEITYLFPGITAKLHQVSIDDTDALERLCRQEGFDAIVHGASRVGFEPSIAEPKAYYQTNIMGFVNVCEVARKLDIRKMVLISSNSVYHKGTGDQLTEQDLPFSISHASPAAHYGTSKMASEAIGMAYSEFHGVDFHALRVTAIYGFGMRHGIHIKPMVENSVRGLPTRFETGGRMKRDYTHVQDCADAVIKTLQRAAIPTGAPRIFNISAGRLVSGRELAHAVTSLIPSADITIEDEMSKLEEENVKMRAALNCSLAAKDLGWAPKFSLEEGIIHFAETYRKYLEKIVSVTSGSSSCG